MSCARQIHICQMVLTGTSKIVENVGKWIFRIVLMYLNAQVLKNIFCYVYIFVTIKFIFTTRSEFWSNLYLFRWHESMDLGRGRCRCCIRCLCSWYLYLQMHLCTKEERYLYYVENFWGIFSGIITHITSSFLLQSFHNPLDVVSNATNIVPQEPAPATIHRFVTFPLDETPAPSVSYSSNQTPLPMIIPTAPLESPRYVQPYTFPTTVTEDDPPSYSEAISTQNSPRPGAREMCNH